MNSCKLNSYKAIAEKLSAFVFRKDCWKLKLVWKSTGMLCRGRERVETQKSGNLKVTLSAVWLS